MRGLFLAVLVTGLVGCHTLAIDLHVDFSQPKGTVRPLHGINKGPLASGGMINLTAPLRELALPLIRLHDCQWPYPEVVDMHAIFRHPGADPARPQSYDWALTDAYLAAVRETGTGIVYRLGESIEHGPVKRFAHPPSDVHNWAAACVGIVRHYNEGWANGTNHNIRYWEIWNEPENRPAMWSGTDEDYLRLYFAAARAIKKHDPTLNVGGPSLGYSGALKEGRFIPSEFVTNFLEACRMESVPLDFFSWHCYTADPTELTVRARGVRSLLDEYGFRETESHLNEWNYLPGNTWSPFGKSAKPEVRQKFYEEMAGAGGAAFVTTALIELQDAPVDACNFYHGELGAFGLFSEFGVPNRVYYVLRAFARIVALGTRAAASGAVPGKVAVLASGAPRDGKAGILVSNFGGEGEDVAIRLEGFPLPVQYRTWVVDAQKAWDKVEAGRLDITNGAILRLRLFKPAVAFVELQPL